MKTFRVIKEIEAENEADAIMQIADEINVGMDLNQVFKLEAIHASAPEAQNA